MKKRLSLVILSVILCVSALCSVMFMTTASAEETSGTISFANATQRTTLESTKQIWENDGVKFTNNKASSSSAVADYSNPVRLYQSSSITFEAPGNITKIEVIANSSSYATLLKDSVGDEATVSKSTVTITPSKSDKTYTVAKLTKQIRLNSLIIYYEAAPSCAHKNTVENITNATCSAEGVKTVTCSDCREVVSTETIPALGHNYGEAIQTKAPSCTEDGVTEQKCSGCGDVITGSVPALGHTFVEGVCSVCGDPDPDACRHNNKITTTKDATKTEDGSIVITCEDCNKVLSTTVIPALGCNVKFVVPNGVVAPSYESGVLEVILPVFDGTLPNGNYKYEYTFVGWAMGSIEDTSSNPELYTAGDRIPLNDDVVFYAVYKYNAGGGSSWELKDLSAITSDDVVVITMTKDTTVYALTNGNGTSKAPAATIIKVASGKITSDISDADALKWNIVKSGSNLTIHPNGDTSKWLYCISDNNGVRVGTNANKTFTVDSATGYLKHTATNRYVGVYTTNPDWRCYTTNTGNSNIANQTLGFYVLTASEFFTTNIQTEACEHSYESKVTKDATCTELGVMTYTCSKCGESYTEDIPLADHHYVEEILNPTCNAYGTITNTCSGCGDTEIEYIAVKNHVYVDGICECGKKQSLAEFTFGENSSKPDPAEDSDGKEIGSSKTYTVIGSDGKEYTLALTDVTKVYDGAFDAIGKSALKLATTNDPARFTFVVPDEVGAVIIYVAGYKSNNAKISINGVEYDIAAHSADGEYTAIVVYTYTEKTITLETIGSRAKIDAIEYVAKEAPEMTGASLTAGADLSLNYEVTLAEGDEVSNYQMKFVMNGFEYFVNGELVSGNKYVFKFTGIAPQSIADEVDAYLMCGDEVIVSKEGFSVKKYAECFLEQYGEDPNYKKHITLLGDILAYGEAANDYTGFKPDADFSVDGLGASTVTPDAGDKGGREISASTAEGIEFASAGVRFQYNNKIYVKFDADKDVILLVNGVEVEFEALGDGTYVYYTDGILATDFDTIYTFELVYNGETVQTLKYSVNAYAISKYQQETPMGKLALALYRYGVSADAIAESAN